MKRLSFFVCLLLAVTTLYAQGNKDRISGKIDNNEWRVDPFVQRYIDLVATLQSANGNKRVCQSAVDTLSSLRYPKIALLDDLGEDKNEYRGSNANPLKINSIVVQAWQRQQGFETSRGYYYDSRQRGIRHSMMEKSVAARATVHYSISEHSGRQELVVIPYSKNARYRVSVTCDGQTIPSKLVNGKISYWLFVIDKVTTSDVVKIEIENQSDKFESFVIINYNQRR